MHRYYQEQYQLDGGKQDRYVTGSDAVGLTHGLLRHAARCRSTSTCTRRGHPAYAIADDFFQAAFGGSFLNHQWLVAAATPTWPGAVNDGGANDLHSVVDANGMPTNNYPLYTRRTTRRGDRLEDGALTASCQPPAGRGPPRRPA